MNAIIIEDEVVAAETLRRTIHAIRPDISILAVLQSVEESVEWLNAHPAPDLAFMDIHLADGSSFSIFDQVKVDCPVIFTTAYNEYALEAFEVSGIDYLLKPINRERLARAIKKFEDFSHKGGNSQMITSLIETLNQKQTRHKTHFLVPHRDKLIPLPVDQIAYCTSELKVARVFTFDSNSYMLDHSLEDLMKRLDPERFFRVNRQYIVAHKAVEDLSVWFAGKLSVNLSVPVPERIIVSKPKASEFKAWFTKEY